MQGNTKARKGLRNSLPQSTGGPGFSSRATDANGVEDMVLGTSPKPTSVVTGGPGYSSGSLRPPRCLSSHYQMNTPITSAYLRLQFHHHHRVLVPGVSPLSLRKTTLCVRTLLRPPSSKTKSPKSWNQ